jgi:tRNA-specific 2-thiouridylase
VDARTAFTAGVIEPFADAYISGRTPNPCIECNRAVKFDALLRVAAREGAGLIATGHYARLERTADSRSRDVRKDQSYVLYALTQETLGRLLLPIGELAKEDVRRIARENSLPVADKADSVEICFVPDGDHGGFLSRFRPGAMVPGPVSDIEGRTVGTHEGIARYTIGQRRGLGVAAGERRYVVRIDAGGNRVVLGTRSDLEVSTIDVESMNWVSVHEPASGPVFVQYRSTMTAVPGEFSPGLHGGGRVRFSSPQYGVAAGQASVLYDGDRLLGGGTVAATSPISALVEAL